MDVVWCEYGILLRLLFRMTGRLSMLDAAEFAISMIWDVSTRGI